MQQNSNANCLNLAFIEEKNGFFILINGLLIINMADD